MKILLLANDEILIRDTIKFLEKNWKKISFSEYQIHNVSIHILITGYSPIYMPYAICQHPMIKEVDRIIYAGLAIATNRIMEIGHTVNIGRDIFGDIGVEGQEGSFSDLFDLGLMDSSKYPFFKGEIFNEKIINPTKLEVVKSVSVSKIPGTWESIEELTKKYHTDVLSMNGAAFAYTCRLLDVKYLQLRTVYRYLEPTTVPNREMGHAIQALNKDLLHLLDQMEFDEENPNLIRLL